MGHPLGVEFLGFDTARVGGVDLAGPFGEDDSFIEENSGDFVAAEAAGGFEVAELPQAAEGVFVVAAGGVRGFDGMRAGGGRCGRGCEADSGDQGCGDVSFHKRLLDALFHVALVERAIRWFRYKNVSTLY